jgi:hypothetical protein
MRKFLVATVAAAALIAGAAPSFAQEVQGGYYVIDGQGGTKLVVGPANPEGTELLMAEGDAAPANCPAGSFWQATDGSIVACDDATAMFDLQAPEQGATMPNTEPYPENAMLMIPRDTGESDSDADTNTGGQGSNN